MPREKYDVVLDPFLNFGVAMQSPRMPLRPEDIDRIIMMAWEDRTSFDAIQTQFGLTPGDVIKLMRREVKPSSFRLWRQRTSGRKTKHEQRFAGIETKSGLRRFRAASQRG